MDSLIDRDECAHAACGKARFACESPWCAEHALIAIAERWPDFPDWREAMHWTRERPTITAEQFAQRARDRRARGVNE